MSPASERPLSTDCGAGRLRTTASAFAIVHRSARGPASALVVTAVALGVGPPLAATALRNVLNALTTSSMRGTLHSSIAALAGLTALIALVPPLATYAQAMLTQRVRIHTADALYAAINADPGLGQFEDPASLDRIHTAHQQGASSPSLIFLETLALAQSAITVVGFAATLAPLGASFLILVLGVAVPSLLAQIAQSKRRAYVETQLAHRYRREMFFGGLMTDVRSAKEIRLFGTGDFLRRLMSTETHRIFHAKRALDHKELVTKTALTLLGTASATVGLTIAALKAASADLSVGSVALVFVALTSTQASVAGAIDSLIGVHQSLHYLRGYLQVTAATDTRPLPQAQLGDLKQMRLEDVWFRYTPDQPWVLRGISLTIDAGTTVGLVGSNGAGKSTLVKILCGMYVPTRGRILWNGQDITACDPAQLRSRVSAVFQDAVDYDLSAAVNVGLGRVERIDDIDAIRTAARRAGVDGLLQGLPAGYQTNLTRAFTAPDDEAEGVQLSGGQWQRVAFARSLMRHDADILLLDEPSSGLDPLAEEDMRDRVRTRRRGATTLLVSHRLNTLRGSDTILTLSDGSVSEAGTHEQLVTTGGIYASMFAAQAAGYLGDGPNQGESAAG